MIEDGCLEDVDEIFCYHNVSGAPIGMIGYIYGPALAGVAEVTI